MEPARTNAAEQRKEGEKLAVGKTLHGLRGAFATRLKRHGFQDRDIDEIMGWETGRSARIRRRYFRRKAGVISAIERMLRKLQESA